MKQNIVKEKSFGFAVRCVNLYKYLTQAKHEFVISKQLLRSGTSVGANIKEAIYAQSEADFAMKMKIAQKEAAESEYWIELLVATEYLSENEAKSLIDDCSELIKLLASITKTIYSK